MSWWPPAGPRGTGSSTLEIAPGGLGRLPRFVREPSFQDVDVSCWASNWRKSVVLFWTPKKFVGARYALNVGRAPIPAFR